MTWVVCVPCNCGILETKIRICSICSPHHIHTFNTTSNSLKLSLGPELLQRKLYIYKSKHLGKIERRKLCYCDKKTSDKCGECILSKLVINGKTSIGCHPINCNWNKEVNRKLALSSPFFGSLIYKGNRPSTLLVFCSNV